MNTLIPLISRVGSFKVSNGERFRLIKRRRLGSPDFAENLRSVASPLSIIRSISLSIGDRMSRNRIRPPIVYRKMVERSFRD